MIAIIGGETHRFRPLVDLYCQAGLRAGHSSEQLKVEMHALGNVAETTEQAVEEMYAGDAVAMSGSIAKDRGFPPVKRSDFDAQFLTLKPDRPELLWSGARRKSPEKLNAAVRR